MECKIARNLLETYLDNELERADARELEAHVDGCAECRAALTQLDELRRTLREHAPRYTAPAALRDRIAATDVGPDQRLPARRRSAQWLSYAAACLLAFGAGGVSVHLWNSQNGVRDELAHDAFASHWRALAAASPVDVVSSDRHTVKPWFAGKLAQAPLVQDFADQGFPLVGGRLDYLGNARVPVLVYRHGAHLIDVFVLPQGQHATPALRDGYALESARVGGADAAVVTDMDRQELARLLALLDAAH